MNERNLQHIAGLTESELRLEIKSLGEPDYRGTQIFKGVHQRRLESFRDFTDLPKELRDQLSARFDIRSLKLRDRFISRDGTRRFLFETSKGNPVETVFIPTEKRDTICFSSQSGCALDCDFCLTAKLGFLENLSAGEIIEQVIFVLNDVYGVGQETPHGTNLVAMGAGEPFQNFRNLMKASSIMNNEDGLFIVPDRITVSTAGVVPKIDEFAGIENRPHLAISLSAPNDELRDVLMPINKRWNIEELMNAAKRFENTLRRRERFTFEYVLLQDVNDNTEHAVELVGLIRKHKLTRVKVNLIPHNSADTIDYRPSSDSSVIEFKKILESNGIDAFVRKARGDDIFAACGQLSARKDEKNALSVC